MNEGLDSESQSTSASGGGAFANLNILNMVTGAPSKLQHNKSSKKNSETTSDPSLHQIEDDPITVARITHVIMLLLSNSSSGSKYVRENTPLLKELMLELFERHFLLNVNRVYTEELSRRTAMADMLNSGMGDSSQIQTVNLAAV